MEYLVTMTTHVPAGISEDTGARLWQASGPAEMQAMLRSLPLDPWMTVQTTPLTRHPSDPASRS